MILVSGTGRCGTSMWMQALAAAGFPVVGEAFPRDWADRIGAANTRGFYESTLIDGINFTTNPDPRTGARLVPAETRDVVAKVFLHGVRRTDRPFLDHVLVSVRHWRAVAASVARLNALERATAEAPLPATSAEEVAVGWFLEHVAALQDVLRRGYPTRFLSYEDALAAPARVVGDALAWLGAGARDVDRAVAAVAPELRTQDGAATDPALPAAWVAAFEELYERLREDRVWEPAFLGHLGEIQRQALATRRG